MAKFLARIRGYEVEMTWSWDWFLCVFCRLYLADEQLLQGVNSVQQLANMETELEQALERVRARKVIYEQNYILEDKVSLVEDTSVSQLARLGENYTCALLSIG